MSKPKIVLFLGSGATAGSGIKNGQHQLPPDARFFKSDLVNEKIGNGFPALNLIRNDKSKCFLVTDSLYQTWNDLFIFRGLDQAGLIRVEQATIDQFHSLSNYGWPDSYQWRRAHYQHQFEVMDNTRLVEYYVAELAIWDLRSIVKEIYEPNSFDGEKYCEFWNPLSESISVVVNMNYDTTFDQALPKRFFYSGDSTSNQNKKLLIRPHGSLDWTSIGRFLKQEQRFSPDWTPIENETKLREIGYRSTSDPQTLELYQPLIVTPADFKEEIVGNSSMEGLTNNLLRKQWVALERTLRESDHWAFVGFSMASGDNHLCFLLKRAFEREKERKRICYSYYNKDDIRLRLTQLFGEGVKFCDHPLREGQTIEKFLETKCAHGLGK